MPKSLLLVDDENRWFPAAFASAADDRGYTVRSVSSPRAAVDLLEEEAQSFSCVIIDVKMRLPAGEDLSEHYGGVWLGKWLNREKPDLPFLGCSGFANSREVEWFQTFGEGFFVKNDIYEKPERIFRILARVTGQDTKPRAFIVHGHDDAAKYELKDYLVSDLHFSEPIILHQQAGLGRNMMEKFEHEASDVDVAFVLLTPDDRGGRDGKANEQLRARQNVIFEMGFFVGAFGLQKKGHVIVLFKDKVELPSDIHGISRIDIGNGVRSAGEEIRRELQALKLIKP